MAYSAQCRWTKVVNKSKSKLKQLRTTLNRKLRHFSSLAQWHYQSIQKLSSFRCLSTHPGLIFKLNYWTRHTSKTLTSFFWGFRWSMTVMEKFQWKSCLVFHMSTHHHCQLLCGGPTVQLLGRDVTREVGGLLFCDKSTSGVTKGAASFPPWQFSIPFGRTRIYSLKLLGYLNVEYPSSMLVMCLPCVPGSLMVPHVCEEWHVAWM